MENKAIEISNKNFESLNAYISNYHLKEEILECMKKSMLEFGHYVAEEQKKQCANTSFHNKHSEQAILNSKNVCEQ